MGTGDSGGVPTGPEGDGVPGPVPLRPAGIVGEASFCRVPVSDQPRSRPLITWLISGSLGRAGSELRLPS